jgi:glyoxylase-like metal-dependent hydrolase (beta-lactamase superfamily II)
METVFPGLTATPPRPLPFAPSLSARAFLLERDQGNLLVYSVDGLAAERPAIEAAGGVARQYLNHHHEAEAAPEGLIGPLVVHELARDAVAARAPVEATYARYQMLGDDFEIIPTPGHTAGSTCFLWHAGEHRALFTGDTIFLRDGDWVAAVLESSDRDRYVESLELIRALDFNVLVPWIAGHGQPYHAPTDHRDARDRIEAILARISPRR